MELKDYIRILKRRFYVIILTIVISLVMLYNTERKKPRIYMSSAEIIIKKPVYEDYYYLTPPQLIPGYTFSYQTRLYFLNSPLFLRRVAEKVVDKRIISRKVQEVLEVLKGGISIERRGDTEIIVVSFKYPEPLIPQKVLEVYIDVLRSFLKDLNESTIESSKKYLLGEKKKLEKKVAKIKHSLKKYIDRSMVFNFSQINSIETKQLAEIEGRLKDIEQQKNRISGELDKLNKNIIPEDIKNLEPGITKKYLEVKNDYEQIDLKIKEELLTKTFNHPSVINLMTKKKFIYDKFMQLQTEYNIEKEKLQKEAILRRKVDYITQLQTLEDAEYDLKIKYNKLKGRIFNILYKKFAKNMRQFETLKFQKKMFMVQRNIQNKIAFLTKAEQEITNNLHGLTTKYNDLVINALLYSKPVEVLEKPRESVLVPAGPSTYRAAYLLAGLLIGLVLAYLLEFTTARIRTQFDVKKYINIPTLISIPKLEESQIWIDSTFLGEVFNTAAILLENWAVKNNAKLISISSATMGEGKTFVASNLALALAKGNRKVLLVDMDLRKPTINKYFNIKKKEFDFYDILNAPSFKDEDLKNALHRYENTSLDILCLRKSLTHSSQILKSETFKTILEYLKKEYEYVVMDSSPLNIIADGVVLASYTDGVILVIASGAVEKADLYYTKFLLTNVGAKIVGAILNKTTYEIRPYYYYYRGYTYKYYGKKKSKEVHEEI